MRRRNKRDWNKIRVYMMFVIMPYLTYWSTQLKMMMMTEVRTEETAPVLLVTTWPEHSACNFCCRNPTEQTPEMNKIWRQRLWCSAYCNKTTNTAPCKYLSGGIHLHFHVENLWLCYCCCRWWWGWSCWCCAGKGQCCQNEVKGWRPCRWKWVTWWSTPKWKKAAKRTDPLKP